MRERKGKAMDFFSNTHHHRTRPRNPSSLPGHPKRKGRNSFCLLFWSDSINMATAKSEGRTYMETPRPYTSPVRSSSDEMQTSQMVLRNPAGKNGFHHSQLSLPFFWLEFPPFCFPSWCVSVRSLPLLSQRWNMDISMLDFPSIVQTDFLECVVNYPQMESGPTKSPTMENGQTGKEEEEGRNCIHSTKLSQMHAYSGPLWLLCFFYSTAQVSSQRNNYYLNVTFRERGLYGLSWIL